MNFTISNGEYYDKKYDAFKELYLNTMKSSEIIMKELNLTPIQFSKLRREVVKNVGYSRKMLMQKQSEWLIGDCTRVKYRRYQTFHGNKDNPKKSFYMKYNNHQVLRKGFIDPLTPLLISNLVDEFCLIN